MGQGNNKLAKWVEQAQELERDLELISRQLDTNRILMFDTAEIPHLRDLSESNFQRDMYLVENALNYMNTCYSQKTFIQEITSNLKKISLEMMTIKTNLIKQNKKYEKLLQKYGSYQGADVLIQNVLQTIDWKRQSLIEYFLVGKQEFDDCFQQSLYEIKSEGNIGKLIFNTTTTPQLKKQTSLDH